MAFAQKLAVVLRVYPPTARYLIGVSGGRDSVALLHGLLAAGYGRLVVCHLDHGLRGRAARADARFVERMAAKLGLPTETGRVDVPALAASAKLSLETAAREARYHFFSEAARRHRCRTLFLAHHADDQVETFLFNLLRGAGPAGLAAMAAESEWTVGRRTLRIVRPMLSIWRTEIDESLQAHSLKWREDATNADPAHATRNRLRAEVLPLLEKTMGREVRQALWRTADILGAEETWIAGLLAAEGPVPTPLPLAALADQPVAKQRRIIRAWLTTSGVLGIGYREVEEARALLDKNNGPAKINLPGHWHARRRQGTLFLEQSEPSEGSGRRVKDAERKKSREGGGERKAC